MKRKNKRTATAQGHFFVPFISDYGFKVTFANKTDTTFCRHALQYLIDSPLPIQKIKLLRNEFEGITQEARAGIYDVICEDEHRQVFIIEMQAGNYENLLERLQFYAFQMYISLVEKGKHGFNNLKPIYCICIIQDTVSPSKKYQQRITLKNEDNEEISDKIIFHLVELAKFPLLQGDFAKVQTQKEKLLYTMKHLHKINPDNPIEVPPFWTEEWLENAIKKLDISKMTPTQKALYSMSLVRQRAIIDHHKKQQELEREQLRGEVREEVRGEVREEVRGEVRGEVREEVRGEVREEVSKEMEETIKKTIQRSLKRGKLSDAEIAEDNNVTLEYVQEIKASLEMPPL